MTLLAERLQRRNRMEHALTRQSHGHFRALPQFRLEIERSAVQLDQILYDRQPEPGATFGGLVGE